MFLHRSTRNTLYKMWRGRRRAGSDPYLVLLMAQLVRQIAQLENKPPVTLALMGACFLAFFDDVLPPQLRPPSVQKACLQPYLIVQNRQWQRLVWSAFLHADEMHLYYNMASFLYKGAQLEPRMGSVKFAGLILELLLLSHGLVVGVSAVASHTIPEYSYLWFRTCAVGFSGVIFALKVVLFHNSPGYSSVMGFRLPTKYLAWAELFIASALNPQASFLGHLCGILAGMLHVMYIGPTAAKAMQTWQRARVAAQTRLNPGQGRFAGEAGVGSSRPAASTSAITAAAAQQRLQAAQQRGIPSMREQHQGQQRVGSNPDREEVMVASSRPLSSEELRSRRLQRFGS